MKKFRIVTDKYLGYEVQIKRWWLPFWFECWKMGATNTFSSIEDAEEWVRSGRNKFKSKFVKEISINK